MQWKVVYICLLICLLVVYSYRQFILPLKGNRRDQFLFYAGLFIKLGGAFALTRLFPKPFGDSYEYFENSQVFLQAFTDDFATGWKLFFEVPQTWDWDTRHYGDQFLQHIKLDPDSFSFVKIIFLISLLTAGNYLLTALFFGWISHLLLWKVFRSTIPKIDIPPMIWMGLIYLSPSCIFWASGLLKDTFAYWILCALFLIHLHWKNKKALYFISMALLISLLFMIKAYLILILGFAGLISLIYAFGMKKLPYHPMKSFLVLSSINVLLVLIISTLIVYLPHHIGKYTLLGFANHINGIENWNTRPGQNTAFHYGSEVWDTWKVIWTSPIALFTGLFRPFIWEAKSLMMIIFSMESLALLLTFMYFIKKEAKGLIEKISSNPILIFLGISIVLFAYIIGISTFNFGALSRYKTPLFFLIILFIYYFKQTMKKLGNDSLKKI